MRPMKNLHFIFLAALISACSLIEDDSLFISPEDCCKSIEQCDAAVASAYTQLNTIYSYQFEIATEACTDLYHCMSTTQDAQMDVSPANARFGNTMWEYGYAGVRNANYAIWGMENSTLDATALKPLLAEAKIMRAFWYYLLTSFFGDIPFYTNYIYTVPDIEAAKRLPRMSAIDTRESLIRELQACLGDLPQLRRCDAGTTGSDKTLQRAGAAMGYMVLAKMAMWNGSKTEGEIAKGWWNDAIAALEALESIYDPEGTGLAAYPLSDIPYSMKNTPESIFEVQHTYSTAGLKHTSNLAAIMMPYDKESKTITSEKTGRDTTIFLFGGVEVPELGENCTVWQPLRPNTFMNNGLFTKADKKDKRKDMTLVWAWNGKDFKRSWSGPKFWCYDMYSTSDSNNYTIFRYADAVLMLAECYNEIDDPDNAMKYLNQVKSRAGITLYTSFKSKDRLREEIQNERGRELAGEFQRKFDLVRWGNWYQRVMEFNDYDNLKNHVRPCHEYYPIPDTQVALSDGALDNKAYEQGL